MADLGWVDFRGGGLTDSGGFDSTAGANAGSITIDEDDPPVGIYAADWPDIADAYGVLNISASSEVYTYIYLILDSAPSADQTVLQILNNSTVVGEIDITASRTLLLKNNDTQIGSASSALTTGELYRIAIRQKAGGGSDGELEGYLAEKHKGLSSFASSTSETFTTDADEIRAGACDAVAFDGRIGYLVSDSTIMPGSWLKLHDFVIGPLGLMRMPNSAGVVGDLAPAHDRAALGEKQHDTFATSSFASMANFAGGVGQQRLEAMDKVLTGIFDGRFPGYAFPPRALQSAASTGGTAFWYFDRGSQLYGITATDIEEIGTSNTFAIGSTLRTPQHQPVVDGQNNVYWVSSSDKIAKWTGSGSPTDVTPSGFEPKHVAQYGRFVWAFAERDIPTLDFVRSRPYSSSGGTNHTVSFFGAAPSAGPDTVVIAVVYTLGVESHSTELTMTSQANGWDTVDTVDEDNGSNRFLTCSIFANRTGGEGAKSISVEHSAGARTVIHLLEFEGTDAESVIESIVATDTGTTTTLALSGGTSGDAQIAGAAQSDGASFTVESGWTTAESSSPSGGSPEMRGITAYRTSSDTAIDFTSMDNGSLKVGFHLALDEDPDAGSTQFVILATDNSGDEWIAAQQNFAMNLFGSIRASVPTAGALWLVTERGLFRMAGEGTETVAGELILTNAITQHDKWERPKDDNAGKWAASFQGQIYYTVGGTIRRYTPNSDDPNDDRAFWPNPEWATVVDQVQALVSNEGGLWWGAAGYLWNFSGRGFHQMAAESTSGDFDYLYWHSGNLYVKSDPAKFYKFGYPTVRPDILMDQGVLDQDDFTTGYIITSSLDFEKVADPKVIQLAESQVSFTDQSSNSGDIDFHYRNGCDTVADPGVKGGGDTTSTWTSWGTHDFSSGGYERMILSDPLQCYRLYVRATLNPGTAGIPVLHFFTIWGRSIMPSIDTTTLQLQLQNDQRNHENKVMFDDVSQVYKMLRVLKALRKRNTPDVDLYHSVFQKDGTDGGDELLMTFTKLEWLLLETTEDDNRLTINANITFEELPG